jgi:membrane-bound serine protease (ClpP class)
LVLGALILVKSPWPEARIHLSTALSVALPLGFITVILVRFAILARKRKAVTGEEGMIGLVGVAQTDLDPAGKVLVRGEIWNARARLKILAGSRVKVLQIEGLTLVVESLPDSL